MVICIYNTRIGIVGKNHTDQVSLKTTSGLGRASILFETTYDMYSKYNTNLPTLLL